MRRTGFGHFVKREINTMESGDLPDKQGRKDLFGSIRFLFELIFAKDGFKFAGQPVGMFWLGRLKKLLHNTFRGDMPGR